MRWASCSGPSEDEDGPLFPPRIARQWMRRPVQLSTIRHPLQGALGLEVAAAEVCRLSTVVVVLLQASVSPFSASSQVVIAEGVGGWSVAPGGTMEEERDWGQS